MKMKRGLLVAGLVLFMSALAYATFFQGFETDTNGWFGATRVMSGTHGVPSKTGAFHAEDTNFNGNTFTRWGGYSKTFPARWIHHLGGRLPRHFATVYEGGVATRTTHGSIGPPPSTNRTAATGETSSSTLASTPTQTLRAAVPGS